MRVHCIWQQMWSIACIVFPTYIICIQIITAQCFLMEDSAYVSKTAITLDFTGYTDDIAQTVRCVLNLGANVEYNTHKFIVISALETEIRRFEYLSLNMQNCNFAGFHTVQS